MKDNNIRAEAFEDQVRTAMRNGDPYPEGNYRALVARSLTGDEFHPKVRNFMKMLFDDWAKEEGVERPTCDD